MSKKKKETLRDYCPWLGFYSTAYFFDREGKKEIDIFDYSIDTPVFKVEKSQHDVYFVYLDVDSKEHALDSKSVISTKNMIDSILQSDDSSTIEIRRNMLEDLSYQLGLLSKYQELGSVEEFAAAMWPKEEECER